jgi:ferredoxin
MPKIKIREKEIEVPEDTLLSDIAQQSGLDVPCRMGVCGACVIKVIKGMENLTEKTQQELDMDLEENERLACQCRIKKGEVTIDF